MKRFFSFCVFFTLLISCGSENADKNPLNSAIDILMSSEMQTQDSLSSGDNVSSSSIASSFSSSEGAVSSSSITSSSSSRGDSVSSSSIANSSSSIQVAPCKTETEDNCIYGELYDERNEKTYKTVKIGNQEWMAENLNLDYKGDLYAICRCDPDSMACSKYGNVCHWPAIVDQGEIYNLGNGNCVIGTACKPEQPVTGICPAGWHVPSGSDFENLFKFVGGRQVAGKKLRSRDYKGDDSYGFSLLSVNFANGEFYHGDETYLATSTEGGKDYFEVILFDSNKDTVYTRTRFKTSVAAVRCLKK